MTADKERQVRNGLIYMFSQAMNTVLPMIAIYIFSRILSKEDYGTWGLAQVYGIIASGVVHLGMRSAYERNFFQYRTDARKLAQLLYSTLLFVFGNFFLICAITFVFRGWLAAFFIGSAVHGSLLFWAFCGQFSYSVLSYYLAYFRNLERAVDYAAYTFLFGFFNLALAFVFVGELRTGVIGLAWGQVGAGVIVFVLQALRVLRWLRPAFGVDVMWESLVIAFPLTPRIFFGVINTQFDKYMLGLLGTVGGVGIYNIGQRVATATFSSMNALQNVYFPQVYKRMFDLGDASGEAVGQYLTPFAYLSVFPALLIALFAEEAISLLTPPSFHEASPIITILAMYYGTLFFGKQPQLIFAKKTYMASLLVLASIGINAGLNIPFIIRWGAVGAAWATLLGGIISGAIAFLVSQYFYEIKWEYRKIFSIYALFLLPALALVVMKYYAVAYVYRLLVKVITVGVYILLGTSVGVVTKSNMQMCRDLFRRVTPAGGVPR